ncbi:MAG: cache domain-containing protein, partial [Anaerolineales bacterium]
MLRRPDFYRLLARWRALGLRERLLAYLVVFWFLPVVIGVGVILAIQRQDAQVDAIQHLEVLADSRQAILQDWRESALEHAAEVAGLIVLCSPEMGGQACDLRELLATESLGAAAEISLLDPATARVILSTDPVQEGKIRAGQDYFQSGRNQASLSGIFYDLALDEPAQIASTPVRNQVGEVMGVVAVRLDVCKLDAKVAAHTGLGAAGNVYLVNRDGFLLTSGRYKAG